MTVQGFSPDPHHCNRFCAAKLKVPVDLSKVQNAPAEASLASRREAPPMGQPEGLAHGWAAFIITGKALIPERPGTYRTPVRTAPPQGQAYGSHVQIHPRFSIWRGTCCDDKHHTRNASSPLLHLDVTRILTMSRSQSRVRESRARCFLLLGPTLWHQGAVCTIRKVALERRAKSENRLWHFATRPNKESRAKC